MKIIHCLVENMKQGVGENQIFIQKKEKMVLHVNMGCAMHIIYAYIITALKRTYSEQSIFGST